MTFHVNAMLNLSIFSRRTCVSTLTFSFNGIPTNLLHNRFIKFDTEALEALIAVRILKESPNTGHVGNEVIPYGVVCFVPKCLNYFQDVGAWYETSATLERRQYTRQKEHGLASAQKITRSLLIYSQGATFRDDITISISISRKIPNIGK